MRFTRTCEAGASKWVYFTLGAGVFGFIYCAVFDMKPFHAG